MLKKLNRLTKNKEFETLFKKGKSKHSKLFKIIILKNNSLFNKYGVIVSNKISNKAVVRNKIKRRIKYVLQKHKTKIKQGYDIVIITYPIVVKESFKNIESELAHIFTCLKLIKK